jgi:Zn-dependent metalloprotease
VDSEGASQEDKDRAQKVLDSSDAIREARAGARPKAPKTMQVNRMIYDCKESNDTPGDLSRKEGAPAVTDVSVNEVYDYFGKTYDFYSKEFSRNSIDNKGLTLIGSVHYDDIPGPPGYDNAFWDGGQMIFGDGDGTYFGTFTRSLDV